MDFRRIDLIHLDAVWGGGADFFIRRGGPRAEHKWSLRLVACLCGGDLSFCRGHSLESSRGHADRRIDFRAQDFSLCPLPFAGIDEGGLLQLHVVEHLKLLPEGHLVVCARVEVIVCVSEVPGLRKFLVVGDLV